jgi:P4 family phage/plasmid primase-like protien
MEREKSDVPRNRRRDGGPVGSTDVTDYHSIPHSLAERAIWLGYRLEDRGNGRKSKPPVSPKTGRVCSKTDEYEQVTLAEALVGAERYDLDGVGIVLSDSILCIDLDDCFEESGVLKPVPQDVFDHFSETYWEYSCSGEGLHGYLFGTKPNDRTKDSKLGIEVYGAPNFIVVTGDRVEGTADDTVVSQDALEWLYATYLPPIFSPDAERPPVEHGERTPEEWLAFALSKDTKLSTLYGATDHDGDESSTDFSLLSKLAYWLNRDVPAMQDAFLASPWVHSKDASHAKKLERADYLPDSTAKAAALCSNTAYEWSRQNETKAVRYFSGLTQSAEPVEAEREEYTDLGNATAMAKVFAEVLCYTPEWGWCFFDGTRWETDVSFRAMEAARDIAQGLMTTAKAWLSRVYAELETDGVEPTNEEGKDRLKQPNALYAHALKSQSEHGITAMVGLNKAYMVASAATFNTDPWLLNTPQGVVDLKSGEVMPHAASYRLTTMSAVTPAKMPTPRFDAFMQRIFAGDEELIEFVQTTIGSALVGKVYTENLIVAYGTGANGKSTLFNTFHYLLGDYATGIDPDLLMSSKTNEQQVGMAMLDGKRFAIAQETEEGQRLRGSTLKKCVSTDTMVAKRLYKDPHEFTPTHMLVLCTNHLPKVSSTDLGTWRRIIVLPFTQVIPPEEIVTDFHSLLIESEGAGILAWAVEGAVRFSDAGCDIPDKPAAVKAASSEYREAEDWVANFVQDCCHPWDGEGDEPILRHSDLYHSYARWAKNTGEYTRSANAFGRALLVAGWRCDQKHYDAERNTTAKAWMGYTLTDSRRFVLTQGAAK